MGDSKQLSRRKFMGGAAALTTLALLSDSKISKAAQNAGTQNTTEKTGSIVVQKKLPSQYVISDKVILESAVEPCIFYNEKKGIYEMVFRDEKKELRAGPSGDYLTLGYAYSKDGKNWTRQENLSLKTADGVLTGSAFEKDGLSYLLVKNNKDNAFYLYRSKDKKAWEPAGNKPVFAPSVDEKAFDYYMWHPTVLFDGNKAYIYYETKGFETGLHQPSKIGVTIADWKDGKFVNVKTLNEPLLSEGEQLWRWCGVGNPHSVLYVPERDSFMMFLGGVKPSQTLGQNYWVVGVVYAKKGDDLASSAAWKDGSYYLIDDDAKKQYSATPSVLVKDGKVSITYTYDPNVVDTVGQEFLKQQGIENDYAWQVKKMDLSLTPVQLFDLISAPAR